MSIKDSLKSSMKSGMGGNIASQVKRDSPFASTSIVTEKPSPPSVQAKAPNTLAQPVMADAERKTKAELFSKKVLINMSREQNFLIDDFADRIMEANKDRKERITANTVVRCLIDMLDGFDSNVSGIKCEDDLRSFLKEHLKK